MFDVITFWSALQTKRKDLEALRQETRDWRGWLIARGASLPYALTLLGVLGGAIAFGALGIFLGPVLLALGLAMAEEFAGQPRGSWRGPA